MRHPRRERNIEAVVSLVGFAVFGFGLAWSERGNIGNFQVVLFVLGLKTGIVAGVMAIVAHFRDVRPYVRMLRGEGVIARWAVNEKQWTAFSEEYRRLPQGGTLPKNEIEIPADYPARGIEVTVSDNALQLNDDFHPLKGSATVRAFGRIIEFSQRVQAGKTSTRQALFRLPLADSTSIEAEQIVRHYAASNDAVGKLGRKVALGLLAGSLTLLVVVWIAL